MKPAPSKNDRPKSDPRIDLIKAIACVMVTLVHVTFANWHNFAAPDYWWPTNVYNALGRGGLILFIMVTGTTLLNHKEEPLFEFLTKRIRRIVPALFFWSFVYLIWHKILHEPAPQNWLLAIVSAPVRIHLWQLYAYLGLYAVLPFFRRFYRHSSEEEQVYFITLWIGVASLFPVLSTLFLWDKSILEIYKFDYFANLPGLLILGPYIYTRNRTRPLFWLLIYLLAATATAVWTFEYSQAMAKPDVLFYRALSPFVLLSGVAMFRFLLEVPLWQNPLFLRIVTWMGQRSLGLYCVNVLALEILQHGLHLDGKSGSPWWSIPATAFLSILLSAALVWGLRKTYAVRMIGRYVT